MCKYIYDPMRDMLARTYVRHIDMMLFKELQQVEGPGAIAGRIGRAESGAAEELLPIGAEPRGG